MEIRGYPTSYTIRVIQIGTMKNDIFESTYLSKAIDKAYIRYGKAVTA